MLFRSPLPSLAVGAGPVGVSELRQPEIRRRRSPARSIKTAAAWLFRRVRTMDYSSTSPWQSQECPGRPGSVSDQQGVERGISVGAVGGVPERARSTEIEGSLSPAARTLLPLKQKNQLFLNWEIHQPGWSHEPRRTRAPPPGHTDERRVLILLGILVRGGPLWLQTRPVRFFRVRHTGPRRSQMPRPSGDCTRRARRSRPPPRR